MWDDLFGDDEVVAQCLEEEFVKEAETDPIGSTLNTIRLDPVLAQLPEACLHMIAGTIDACRGAAAENEKLKEFNTQILQDNANLNKKVALLTRVAEEKLEAIM